jgi:hypothetical protein
VAYSHHKLSGGRGDLYARMLTFSEGRSIGWTPILQTFDNFSTEYRHRGPGALSGLAQTKHPSSDQPQILVQEK